MGAKRPKRLVLITLQLITFKLLMSNKSAMILKKDCQSKNTKLLIFYKQNLKLLDLP